MNAVYFPDPDNFDPSRFDGNGPAPYTFVPFRGGTSNVPWERVCTGSNTYKGKLHFISYDLVFFVHNPLIVLKTIHNSLMV